MSQLHVVFGASGGIGNAVVREFVRQGKEVRGVNRSGDAIVPPSVEMAAADASNIDDVRRQCKGRPWSTNGVLLSVLAVFNSDMRRLKKEKVYQFQTPWLVDSSKYEQRFGAEVTPHQEAVRQTVAWFNDHPPV